MPPGIDEFPNFLFPEEPVARIKGKNTYPPPTWNFSWHRRADEIAYNENTETSDSTVDRATRSATASAEYADLIWNDLCRSQLLVKVRMHGIFR